MRNSCAPQDIRKLGKQGTPYYSPRILVAPSVDSRTFSIKGQSSLDEQSKFHRISPPRRAVSFPRRGTARFVLPPSCRFIPAQHSYPNNDRNNFCYTLRVGIPPKAANTHARGIITLFCVSSEIGWCSLVIICVFKSGSKVILLFRIFHQPEWIFYTDIFARSCKNLFYLVLVHESKWNLLRQLSGIPCIFPWRSRVKRRQHEIFSTNNFTEQSLVPYLA